MAGQDDPYPLYNRMEDFQRACLGAVAAAAGVTTTPVGSDFDKTDTVLDVLVQEDRSLTLKAQLKSTHALEERDGHVLFDLDAETFNRLRDANSSTAPRVLVVMEVPKEPEQWAACDHDRLLLKRRVFWTHLYGEAPTTNTASKRIRIATDRLLTAETLVPAMRQVTDDFFAARGVNAGA